MDTKLMEYHACMFSTVVVAYKFKSVCFQNLLFIFHLLCSFNSMMIQLNRSFRKKKQSFILILCKKEPL